MKKAGSTLIETIAATFILLMMFIVVATLISGNIRIFIKRDSLEEGNRVIYCIMQELKYNVSFEELLGDENYRCLGLEMYEGLLSDLKKCNVLELLTGDDITIMANLNEDIINIEINILDNNGEILASRNFNKYKWMEYYD